MTVSENIFQNIQHRDIYIPESILSNDVLHNICIQKYLDVEILAYYNIVVIGNTSKGNYSENRIGKNIRSCKSRDTKFMRCPNQENNRDNCIGKYL